MSNDSNLIHHARAELLRQGEDQTTIDWYLSVIEVFVAFGHSGGSAACTIPVLNALLQYENLTPLTRDPEEWAHIAEHVWGEEGGVWQSRRNPAMFSLDGGESYYDVRDVARVSKQSGYPFHLNRLKEEPNADSPAGNIQPNG